VAILDLRGLHLRPGEVRREEIAVALDPFLLGGQRYDPTPPATTARLEISQASGATVFDLRALVHVTGPCMRCLSLAEVEIEIAGRELHEPDAPPGDELRSDYVVEGKLELGTWIRDAVGLALPDRILCRPDCAGLCPVCGKDLNVEPHEHADVETDPRWAALEQLRDDL
jgi:uncharacterized protein